MQVNKLNYHIGCRVCRKIIRNSSVNLFENTIPDFKITYKEALQFVSGQIVDKSDGLPERICADCGARLCISYHFKKDTLTSLKILNSYKDFELSENEKYGIPEEGEQADEMQTNTAEDDKMVEDDDDEEGDDNAVSFLTGFLCKPEPEQLDVIKIRKIESGKCEEENFNDPTRKHVCNVCNKRFQKRSNLIDHLRLHANVKIFACNFCEKSFVQAGNYKAHLRTHTKEKPFICPYCPKSYSQSSSLKIHIRSHTQEKNYVCDTCDKGFTNASDLGKHKLIHDPNKKFYCEDCSKYFTQKIHLKKHMEKHHPDRYYESMLDMDKTMQDVKVNITEVSELVV